MFVFRCRQKGVITLTVSFCYTKRIKMLVSVHMMFSSLPSSSWQSFCACTLVHFCRFFWPKGVLCIPDGASPMPSTMAMIIHCLSWNSLPFLTHPVIMFTVHHLAHVISHNLLVFLQVAMGLCGNTNCLVRRTVNTSIPFYAAAKVKHSNKVWQDFRWSFYISLKTIQTHAWKGKHKRRKESS